jgi:hypothetical protein
MADVIRCREMLAMYNITRGNESASAKSTKLETVSSYPFSPAATKSLQATQHSYHGVKRTAASMKRSYHGGEADSCFYETQKVPAAFYARRRI